QVKSEWVRAFGDTSGPGVLRKVESIRADPAHGRLLVADEDESLRNFKIYTLDGRFTGTMGQGIFKKEPEGLALYECGGTGGYWIATDQHEQRNTFHVLDRRTFAPLGAFAGERTRNTDGVALAQGTIGGLQQGAFYAVHDDSSVSAFAWDGISRALDLACAG
ncbi:MAG TPA: phytase, partial [Vicinamibacteria bacterium]|nr:phytase [Vicinamibacteria bacterium]